MKKLMAGMLAFLMVLGTASCGGNNTDDDDKEQTEKETEVQTDNKTEGKDQEGEVNLEDIPDGSISLSVMLPLGQ